MNREFRPALVEPFRFLHLSVKDEKENAKKFFDEFGGLFHVVAAGKLDGKIPVAVLSNTEGITIMVENRSDGIYVNNNLYCKEW